MNIAHFGLSLDARVAFICLTSDLSTCRRLINRTSDYQRLRSLEFLVAQPACLTHLAQLVKREALVRGAGTALKHPTYEMDSPAADDNDTNQHYQPWQQLPEEILSGLC